MIRSVNMYNSDNDLKVYINFYNLNSINHNQDLP